MISIITEPNPFHVSYNDVFFEFNSTLKNETNYKYIVDVYDEPGTTLLKRFLVPPRPVDKYGQIDLSSYITDYLTYDIFNNTVNQTSTSIKSFFSYKLKLGDSYTVVWDYDDYGYYTDTVGNGLEGKIQLVSSDTHAYSVGDYVTINQTDGGLLYPLIQGLHKVLYVVSANIIVIDVKYLDLTSPGPIMGGTVTAKNNNISYFPNVETSDVYCGFNGTMTRREFYSYDSSEFYTNTINTSTRLLSNLTNEYTIRREQLLYVNFNYYNTDGTSLLTRIVYENDNGDIIRSNNISTSFSSTPKPWIRQTNVGSNMTNALNVVSGTLPLIKPNTKYYTFYLANDAGDQLSRKYKINIDNRCAINNIYILYLDQLGSFLSQDFTLRLNTFKEIEKNTFQRTITETNRNGIFDGTVVYNGNVTTRYSLNTNWLTEEQANLFNILLSSPVKLLYINGQPEGIDILTSSDEVITQKNKKLIRKTLEVKIASNVKINI